MQRHRPAGGTTAARTLITFACIALAICLGQSAQAQPAPSQATIPDEPAFLARWHVEPGGTVIYQNELGQAVPYTEFAAQLRERRPLGKSQRDGITVFRLMDKNFNAKALQATLAGKLQVQPGQPLPPFDLPTLDGQRRNNGMLNGRYSVINFFFAACVPCIAEIPSLNTFRAKHPELNVVAFSSDDVATAKVFQGRYHFEWPIVAQTGPFNSILGVASYPAFALVDPQGQLVAFTVMGNEPSPDEASGKLEHQKLAAWVRANLPAK